MKGTALGSCTGIDCAHLLDSQKSVSHSELVESTPISVDEVLRYVSERLGSVIFLTVSVPLHHIL